MCITSTYALFRRSESVVIDLIWLVFGEQRISSRDVSIFDPFEALILTLTAGRDPIHPHHHRHRLREIRPIKRATPIPMIGLSQITALNLRPKYIIVEFQTSNIIDEDSHPPPVYSKHRPPSPNKANPA